MPVHPHTLVREEAPSRTEEAVPREAQTQAHSSPSELNYEGPRRKQKLKPADTKHERAPNPTMMVTPPKQQRPLQATSKAAACAMYTPQERPKNLQEGGASASKDGEEKEQPFHKGGGGGGAVYLEDFLPPESAAATNKTVEDSCCGAGTSREDSSALTHLRASKQDCVGEGGTGAFGEVYNSRWRPFIMHLYYSLLAAAAQCSRMVSVTCAPPFPASLRREDSANVHIAEGIAWTLTVNAGHVRRGRAWGKENTTSRLYNICNDQTTPAPRAKGLLGRNIVDAAHWRFSGVCFGCPYHKHEVF